MVYQCRGEHAKDDRNGLAIPCSQDEGKELCFVADFGEADHTGRGEERLHGMLYPGRADRTR